MIAAFQSLHICIQPLVKDRLADHEGDGSDSHNKSLGCNA